MKSTPNSILWRNIPGLLVFDSSELKMKTDEFKLKICTDLQNRTYITFSTNNTIYPKHITQNSHLISTTS